MAATPAADIAGYSPDRHTALHLVNNGQIVSVDAIPRHADGVDLAPGLFAALLRLCRAGYVELQHPQAGNLPVGRDCPARLTVAGMQMLTRFRQAHGRSPHGAEPGQAAPRA